jgi:hypothetical protein
MKNVFGTVRQVEPMVDQEGCSIPVLLQEHMAVHNGNFFSLEYSYWSDRSDCIGAPS